MDIAGDWSFSPEVLSGNHTPADCGVWSGFSQAPTEATPEPLLGEEPEESPDPETLRKRGRPKGSSNRTPEDLKVEAAKKEAKLEAQSLKAVQDKEKKKAVLKLGKKEGIAGVKPLSPNDMPQIRSLLARCEALTKQRLSYEAEVDRTRQESSKAVFELLNLGVTIVKIDGVLFRVTKNRSLYFLRRVDPRVNNVIEMDTSRNDQEL